MDDKITIVDGKIIEKNKIEEKENIYSYSRLGTFHNCKYEFYNTYILKNRGNNNAYGVMGGVIHEIMEKLQPKEITKEEAIEEFKQQFVMCNLLGYKFPNENIEKNYYDAIIDFLFWFKPIPYDDIFIEEEFKIDIGGNKLKGFIDLSLIKDDKILLLDWKTSSWSGFSGSKKLEKGRQLALYGEALKEMRGKRPDKSVWMMLKYVNIKHAKRKRSKRIERQKFVQEYMKQIIDDMIDLGYNNIEIGILLEGKRTMKDINDLNPDILKNFTQVPAVLDYDITDETVQESKQYVLDTVNNIKEYGNDVSNFPPVELNKSTSFFCQHLCNHRDTCKYYKEYLKQTQCNDLINSAVFEIFK